MRVALTGGRRAVALWGHDAAISVASGDANEVMLTRSGCPRGRLAPSQPREHVPPPLPFPGGVSGWGCRRFSPFPKPWGGSRHPLCRGCPAAPMRSFPLIPRQGARRLTGHTGLPQAPRWHGPSGGFAIPGLFHPDSPQNLAGSRRMGGRTGPSNSCSRWGCKSRDEPRIFPPAASPT